MSSTNAPQPDAPTSAPAEVFDSTIAQSTGQVSATQLQGGDTREGPVHAGELNGIDPFLYNQFIALTSFIWDTSYSVGQCLWSVPIHPTFVHQFMAHLSKMYNAFVGGFDFAVTIAGTGFHAGKLMVVRLPPNIPPHTLQTTSDITAFPYMVLDPKTLETISKSAMDQRNVMYHYLPFDANNKQTFGGYLAIYVLLPLNTSATGSTQITVQIFSRPAQGFMFSQLRPIVTSTINPFKPTELETALDFRSPKTSAYQLSDIDYMTAWSSEELKLLDVQTLNCVKFDRTPMNGKLADRFDSIFRFPRSAFDYNHVKSEDMYCSRGDTDVYGHCVADGLNSSFFTFDGILSKPGTGDLTKIPQFYCKKAIIYFWFSKTISKSHMCASFPGVLRAKKATDKGEYEKVVFEIYTGQTAPIKIDRTFPEGDMILNGKHWIDGMFYGEYIDSVGFSFLDDITYETEYIKYTPPIPESIITFTPLGNAAPTAQLWEVRQAIMNLKLELLVSEN